MPIFHGQSGVVESRGLAGPCPDGRSPTGGEARACLGAEVVGRRARRPPSGAQRQEPVPGRLRRSSSSETPRRCPPRRRKYPPASRLPSPPSPMPRLPNCGWGAALTLATSKFPDVHSARSITCTPMSMKQPPPASFCSETTSLAGARRSSGARTPACGLDLPEVAAARVEQRTSCVLFSKRQVHPEHERLFAGRRGGACASRVRKAKLPLPVDVCPTSKAATA